MKAVAALVGALVLGASLARTVEAQPSSQPGDIRIENQDYDPGAGAFRFRVRNPATVDVVAWVYQLTSHHANGETTNQRQFTDECVTRALVNDRSTSLRPPAVPPSFIPAGGTRDFDLPVGLRAGLAAMSAGLTLPPEVSPVLSMEVHFLAVVFADGQGFGDAALLARLAESRQAQAADSLATLQALRAVATTSPDEAIVDLRRASRSLSSRAAQFVNTATDAIERSPDEAARKRTLADLTRIYEVHYRALSQAISPRHN